MNSKQKYEEMLENSGVPFDEPLIHSLTRVFDSGASRNSDEGKLDYDGFLSPQVLKSYAEYMHRMRYLEDGTMRDSDNWQKGIPIAQYMKSMWRHFIDVWTAQRDLGDTWRPHKIEQLNALLFNVMGMLHEELKLIKKED